MARQPRQFMRQGVGDLLTRAMVLAYIGLRGEPIFDGQTLRMQDGQTPGGIPLAIAGHRLVADANYQATAIDAQIGVKPLTAPRTILLPDVDSYPLGQILFVADESGACSEALPIRIAPAPGSGDSIAGQASVTLTSPYQGQGFRRGAANLWIYA